MLRSAPAVLFLGVIAITPSSGLLQRAITAEHVNETGGNQDDVIDDLIQRIKNSFSPLVKIELNQFESSATRLIENGRADPCKASLFSVFPWRGGFGSRMDLLANEIWLPAYALAVQSMSRTGGLDEPSWALCSSGSDMETFGQVFDFSTLPICTRECSSRPEDSWRSAYGARVFEIEYGVRHAYGEDGHQVVALQKANILRRLLKYLPETESFLATKLQQVEHPYIGLHIRHGDKVGKDAPYIEFATFADAVRLHAELTPALLLSVGAAHQYSTQWGHHHFKKTAHAVAQHSFQKDGREHTTIKNVFLASDDPEALQQMRHLLGNDFNVQAFPYSAPQVEDRDYDDVESIKALLADFHLLSSSDFFIGTGTSNLGRMVFLHRGADYEHSMSLDAPFDIDVLMTS